MRRKLKPLILALAVAWPLAAAAQVYSWTDAHGTVHYSQSPPPQGVKYHVVKMVGGGHLHGASSSNRGGSHETDGRPGATPSESSDGSNGTPPGLSHYCKSIQSNIKLLQSNVQVAQMTVDGKRKPLSAKRRAEELQHAQAQFANFCRK